MSHRNGDLVVVTGANGFVGRHVVSRLAQAGYPLRALVRDSSGYSPPPEVTIAEADMVRAETLTGALEGAGTVIHCAALTANLKEPYPGAYQNVNGLGTENLAVAAKAAGVRRLVVVSGLGTQPAAAGTYMATRWALEEAVRKSGIPHVILQPSVQFGDGAEFVAALARLIRTSPVVPALGGGRTRFQPIWIDDVVTCVERSITDDALLNRAHAIGGSEYLTFKEILQAIAEVMGKRRMILPLPLPLARLQARLLSAVMSHPPLTSATLELFAFDNATDLDAVERTFGFRPRGLREHLRRQGVAG
jgi:NADH dehydrogenase